MQRSCQRLCNPRPLGLRLVSSDFRSFFCSSRRRHTRLQGDWSSDVCSSDLEGRPPLPVGVYNMAKYRPVSPGYVETIGIPLLKGRWFTPADRADSPWVVVLSASMARKYWGDQDPVGQRLHFAGPTWRTVVGVVGDVLHEGLDGEAKAEMYMPVEQAANIESSPTIVVRTSLEAGAAAAELKAAV